MSNEKNLNNISNIPSNIDDNVNNDVEDEEEGLIAEEDLNELGEEINFENDVPVVDLDDIEHETIELENNNDQMETEVPDESKKQFRDHQDAVYSVASNPSNPLMLASGAGDDLAYIWNVEADVPVFKLSGHTDSVVQVEFSNDGSMLATASLDATVKIWDSTTGTLLHTLEGPSESVECITWHSRGPVIFAGGGDGIGWMWNAKLGKVMNVFSGHTATITNATFTHDGKKLITTSTDKSIKLWDPTNAQAQLTIRAGGSALPFHDEDIVCLGLHPDPNSGLILTGSLEGLACLSNLNTGKQAATYQEHKESVEAVDFVPTLQCAVTGSLDKTIRIWDLNTLQTRTVLNHEEGIVKVVCNPLFPNIVFSCSLDHTIASWDARNGQLIRKYLGHNNQVLDFTFVGGKYIASSGEDKVIRLWELS